MAEVERTSDHPIAHAGGTDIVPTEHRHERPEDWGWHADLGRAARIAGWLTVVALLVMITATQYNLAGTAALLMSAAAVAGGLLIDARKRRTSWRR